MISFGNIKKTYNDQIVLDIDDFKVEEGMNYIITGPNGSGKSTLAKILAGIILDDSTIKKQAKNENNKVLSIGYLTQKPYVFDMNLEKNIMIKNNDKHKCEKLINALNISYLKNKNAKKFSGGEQQKMSLARFMMNDYDIVILDEPTSAMDEASKINAMRIIEDYVSDKTLIMISHDLKQIEDRNKRIIKMENGRINDRTA